MRHKKFGKLLGRNTAQRNALRRTLITQFFQHERITTTRAKAEAIRGAAEQMITKAKRAVTHEDPTRALHVRRLLRARLDSEDIVNKVFEVYAPRYAERPGGYTRMFKLGPRKGDSAELVILELVDRSGGDDESSTNENAGIAGAARGLINRVRRPRRSQAAKSEGAAE